MNISMPELEQAINYWRLQRPAVGEECALSPEVNALADVYALMIINHSSSVALASMGSVAQQLIGAWRQTMLDVSTSNQSMG
ncbi:MAG: DUF3717 domain-containing protein [Collimonas sp.]|jgi:hypothetical protein|uniref:DUF3717 domain-containing protein n=1 Tax=Collimonas sp. OK307 TaxID=1801620 RepID=UPI0008E884E4|nr:DUF3717 domain-containing protein [Collimonas sp. OK307]SFH84507.1 Protein of unknown function [Collimonas sp. OK307]